MSEDICQTVFVDGEPILVRVTSLLTPEEVEAFAWIVRAAKRKHAIEHAEPPVGAKQGSIPDRSSAPVPTRPDATDGSSVSGTPNTEGKADGGGRETRPSPVVGTRDSGEDCLHLHQSDTADFDTNPLAEAIWVCDDCGQVCEP